VQTRKEVEHLLRRLATHRVVKGSVTSRYDPISQTSLVLEAGRWVHSWESDVLMRTKKSDIETGEDQKSA
jgi:hypothetical protein